MKTLEYKARVSGGEIEIDFAIGVANAVPSDSDNDIKALENTARLISTAPDLLNFAQYVLEHWYFGDVESDYTYAETFELVQLAKQVVLKARGLK